MKPTENLYFFTYGTSGQPFEGGWTTVLAPNRQTAVAVFRAYHPDRNEGFVNCADIYTFEEFYGTSMWKNGNLGHREHELITLARCVKEGSK